MRRIAAIAPLVGIAFAFTASGAERPTPVSDDLGVVGPRWPIRERDLLDAILARVRERQNSGDTAKLAERMKRQAQGYAQAPPSLHLARANTHTRRPLDPSLIVPYDIRDAEGHLLVARGTTVNPLEHHPLNKTLVFVDASDEQQRAWLTRRIARDAQRRDKVILTGGSPHDLTATLRRPVYFDQDGTLVARFGIRAVPASVQADPAAPRQRLLVQEFNPEEKTP